MPILALEGLGRPKNLMSVLKGSGSGIGRNARFVNGAVPSISKPRGFPGDLSRPYRPMRDRKQNRVVEASWLLVQEIMNFDWHGIRVYQRAYVAEEHAWLFDRDEPYPPQDLLENVKLFSGRYSDPAPESTIEVEWSSSLAEWVGCLDWFLDELKKHGPPDKVRVIYWLG